MYLVRKSFQASSGILQNGEVVEAKGWKNRDKLVALRFMTKFYGEPVGCGSCDRMFADEDALSVHFKQEHPVKIETEPVKEGGLIGVEKIERPTPVKITAPPKIVIQNGK